MKFTDVKTLEHLLKEYKIKEQYPIPSGEQEHGTNAKQNKGSMSNRLSNSPTVQGGSVNNDEPKTAEMPTINTIKAKDLKIDSAKKEPTTVYSTDSKEPFEVVSRVGSGKYKNLLIVKDKKGHTKTFDANDDIELDEGRLSKIAKRKGKKLKIKSLKGKIKRLSKSRIKESNPKLFEINFNRKEIVKTAFDAPVRCGFEAETFFYSVDSRGSSDDVDNMTIGDIEYEFGDLPDQAYEDYRDWLYNKGQEEYLDDLINDKVEEVKEDEEYLNDFIDSSDGPSSEAVDTYKDNFEEENPKEYENREEDGWEYMNWVREFVEEEYEEEYLEWLKEDVVSDFNLNDEATEAAESDYNIDEFVHDNYSYISSFLDDYGYDYQRSGGDVEGVADELNNWIKANSEFQDYPESGDYGDTYTTTSWAVENDSSIEPDEGAGAELISPVFSSPRKMLTEMKSLFDWSEDNFGTNNSTGLHVTMSWDGQRAGQQSNAEPNKLKMALLLGDEYLLAEFGRLKNSYTKSQYQNVLRFADGMKRGDEKSFEDFEQELTKGISNDKFQAIHFKSAKDGETGTNLIEFRIAGGADYNTMYEKVVKACVRYATIMEAGYTDAFQRDYVNAVFKLLRKSKEIDPKKLKDLEVVNHPVIDSAKNIVGKKDYFDVVKYLGRSVEHLQNYEELNRPNADAEWKQSIKDYQKNTGDTIDVKEVEQAEPVTAYVAPSRFPPSKRAQKELQSAQDTFSGAITMLARDIADGRNRGKVSAKDVRVFREFSSKLNLKDADIQRLTFQSMDDFNFDGKDKNKVERLKKGIDAIFKREVIQEPVFASAKNLESIAYGMWQLFQSNDVNDNAKMDKLADLSIELNPKYDKPEMIDLFNIAKQERTLNGFVSKLRGGGWGSNVTLLNPQSITTPGSAEKIIKFLEPYKGYEHPTGKDHHVNIKSDDPYEEVAQMALVQKMRFRLDHLQDLQEEKDPKFDVIKKELVKIGQEFINTIKLPNDVGSVESTIRNGPELGHWALQLNSRRTETALDFLGRAIGEKDDPLYNFVSSYDDYVIREPLSMLRDYYRAKTPGAEYSDEQKNPEVKKLIKKSFGGFKKFLNAFDKVFTAEGFIDLKAEISNKDRLDKRNKDFEKNVRAKALAKINIPGHSFTYIKSNLIGNLEDVEIDEPEMETTQWFNNAFLPDIKDGISGGKDKFMYVIPSSHWSDANDAMEGLETLKTFEKAKNYFHTWRKEGYRRILNKFLNTYSIKFEDLTDEDEGEYVSAEGNFYRTLQDLNIEVTNVGDSRKGEAGITDLLSHEFTKNKISGEPLSRTGAHSWEQMNDDSEEKRFDAFDWSLYPKKMKSVVAKEMQNDRYGSFQIALDSVLQKVVDREINLDIPTTPEVNSETLMKAAGVLDLGDKSSAEIGRDTNWSNLVDHLKIERGVNDQGTKLFKKVYDQFDSQPSSEREGIGLERWLGCVKDTVKYIKKNYMVSGGNYFRKDADGNIGDDVSDVYSPPSRVNPDDMGDGVTPDSYVQARSTFPSFDQMMSNGMQRYLGRGDVNKLVGFLNNDSNYVSFKQDVLDAIKWNENNGGEPITFQNALAKARRNNESVFKKFDNLSLQEQLKYLEKIDNNKFKKIPNKIKVEGAVPDNTKVRIINKLLSDHMPASDLKKQMDAYFAVPNPQMINDFRSMRVQGGDDACLRGILRNYVKTSMHPSLVKRVNLNEVFTGSIADTKKDVIDKISALPDEGEQTSKIVSYIEQLLNDMGVGGRLASIMQGLENVDDVTVDGTIKKIAKIIASIEMTPLERAQLFAMWNKDTLVDISSITTPGMYSFKNIFTGYGAEVYMTELVDDLADVSGYGIGAGEFLFAVLSKRISGIGSTKGVGDLIIDGKNVEVKTKTAKNARFVDYHVKPDDTWQSKTKQFYTDFADLDIVANSPATGINSSGLMSCLTDPKLIQEPLRAQNFLKQIKGLFNSHMPTLSGSQLTELVNLLNSSNEAQFKKVYGAYNMLNYMNIKNAKGNLDGIMFVDKPTKMVCYIKTVEDILARDLAVGTIYTVTKDKNYPYPQIGITK